MENVVIIGSGCAGFTSAIYTARAGLKPLMFTGTMPGGLLTTTTIVENFPGFENGIDGFTLMMTMRKQAERFGAVMRDLELVDRVEPKGKTFIVHSGGEQIETKTVIIATGAGHRHLGLESEHKLENKGVTYCATCDGPNPIFRNQPLVVVGGGDSALEEAMFLTRFGSKVHLVHRRDQLRASKIMQDRAFANEKIEFVWNSVVEDILDVSQDKVTGVKLKNTADGSTRTLDCAGVFVAIGHVPNTQFVKGLVDTDEDGYILCTNGRATKTPGIFAAGDCVDRVYRQAITAAGLGCAAAIEAERYLAAQE
ncbi:thioredoxin-disulfide reductase [Kamptonema cortianum]|uniref:Thioredoxin reductase n=1 Tax=Geitlerinema calcuttense NRMC-F 0142 TaxID=2922238 RepID=A0ABT7LZQ3_9CYAN|nr:MULTISPECIES: thioredoxin-disulfide reductase [Cyanophyceae]MDK3156620.1 thioredoxin-disulfide reductase [Kamptonema cortianum]MDL5050370.1 thioredoxin-disulfide reductase [Oscillatoria amoena NRMC-F 0135]MDL5054233.1 thioredoxin-disulfide reductase [Oscillatoria laete-virens NRMC-F 0139]MDL5057484.1 thioredoxin-disulfide reductase [Geitlerinema calcuttense NRMC-F 0142]